MNNQHLAKISLLASLLVTAACASDIADDHEVISGLAGPVLAEQAALEEDPGDLLPWAVTSDQLDTEGRVIVESLPCGLSILVFPDYTAYWIRNCLGSSMEGYVIAADNDSWIRGRDVVIETYSLVSGSERGRVLRFRRR